jgi:hypothetical protein
MTGLFYPMAVMVFYIAAIGVFNFRVRKAAAKDGSLRLGYFSTFDATKYQPPEYVVRVGRHYNNQYELPQIFFITCLAGIVTGTEGLWIVLAAWGFILSRMAHSFIHLGSNHIIKRALAFAAGWVFILIMWVILVIKVAAL